MVAAVETMAYGRGIPWHGLGVKTPTELTSVEEMIHYAGLDWEVQKLPMVTEWNGQMIQVPNSWANTRMSDGSVLGVVGDSYRNVQPREGFNFADALLDAGVACETAGSLFGGRRIFISLEIPEVIHVPGDDERGVTIYLLVTNSFDGSSPLIAAITPVRVVCNNTLNLALAGARRTFRIRHTGSIDGKIAQAREALGITYEYAGRLEEVASRLVSLKVTERTTEKILREAFPVPPTQDKPDRIDQSDFAQVLNVYRTSENLDPIRGTGWGILQATAEYLDHVVDYHGRRFSDIDVRMDSIVYDGPAALKKQKVLNILAPMAKVPVLVKR